MEMRERAYTYTIECDGEVNSASPPLRQRGTV
jgi:hypothetical protein